MSNAVSSVRIIGGHPLYGSINISGSKNAVLPMMAASLICRDPVVIKNVPDITDVSYMATLISHCGAFVDISDETAMIKAESLNNVAIPNYMTSKLRASVLVMGALLARTGSVDMSMPGGCAIGTRPIDFHINSLRAMGARIEISDGRMTAIADNGLRGTDIIFPNISVGATENIMIAAALANGITVLHNAAIEPEIIDLINMLRTMDIEIEVLGNNTIIITGGEPKGCEICVSADRIEAGTYAMATAATGGKVELCGVDFHANRPWIITLKRMGIKISHQDNKIIVDGSCELLPISVTTRPHPHFPSDLQAQLAALALRANGMSIITETIYENRVMYVAEMRKFGAAIHAIGNRVIISKTDTIHGIHVKATDLRAAGALVIAGLCASGETIIDNMEYAHRGYHKLIDKLSSCGADIAYCSY